MKLQIVSIRDNALDAFQQPWFTHTIGAAIRAFGDEVTRGGDSQMTKHPEDYELYHLGEYDDNNGKFTMLADGPKQIARAKDHIAKQ